MPTSEIVEMLKQAAIGMATGVPAVFLVLAVFYGVIKLFMLQSKRRSAKHLGENDGDKR